MSIVRAFVLLFAAALFFVPQYAAQAELLDWDVDPVQSYLRLTIPDQEISLDGTAGTIRLRDANSTSVWTDAGGRSAFLDGTIKADYVDGASIDFIGGMHNLFALEQNSFRPNPAQFDSGNTNAENPDGQYSGTGTAPAAYAAKVRASVSLFTLDVGYLAVRDVALDLDSGSIALGGGTSIAADSTDFTISDGTLDFDGQSIIIIGQPIPDQVNEPFPELDLYDNIAGGSVVDIGGNQRKLTLNVDIPVEITLEGVTIVGSGAGVIVAFATLPTPPSADFDMDGDVDGSDFLLLQTGYGTTYNVDDYDTFKEQYGSSMQGLSVGNSVPEPMAISLLAICGSLCACLRWVSRK